MRNPALLTGVQLLARLERAALLERLRLADFLACLSEADRRNSAIDAGFGSLFEFCVQRLRLSEDEAYKRIRVARRANEFPELYSYIKDGAVSLTAAAHLAPHLTRENAARLLEAAVGKRIREVDELLAPLVEGQPRRDVVKPVKRAVPTPAPPPAQQVSTPCVEQDGLAPGSTRPDAAALPAATRFQFSFEGSTELRALVERAKDMVWHKYPFARLEDVLTEALREFVERRDPLIRASRREASRKLAPEPTASSRAPRSIRDAVWARDGGRCVFLSGGRRCESRRGLELDHILPLAAGGTSSASNLRLLCRAHNQAERRRILGEGAPALPF